MIQTMKIGNVTLPNRYILAPMAGVTDLPFRLLCKEQGAGLVCMEMVSAKAILYGNRNTKALLEIHPEEHPVSLQLFGSDPEIMAEIAKRTEELPYDLLDINMGCPVPKIVKNGEGSALMKQPLLAGKIIRAVSGAIKKPVTVKIRKGFDDAHVNAVEMAKIAEESGAAAVAVHGRTREQYYSGKADWDIIRQVKEAVQVPVIGNGDVVDAQSACQLLDATGCDLVLVGRGAMGNPWVFRQINAYLTDSCTILPPPGIAERIVVIRRHMDALCALKGEDRAMREARKHVGWYLHGVRGAAQFRRQAGELCTLGDLDRLLAPVYAANQGEE